MISLGSPKAALAVVLLFFYNGLVIGVYAAAIPTLVQRFGLTPLQLSMLFVAIGVAAIASMQASGRLSDRFGARRISLAMIPVLVVGILGIGLAPNIVLLVASAVLLGLGNGGIDVAMNAVGVQVEQNRPKPIMSFFHGMWSVGNLVGAALIVGLAPLFERNPEPTVVTATAIASALGLVVLAVAVRITPETALTPCGRVRAKTPIPLGVPPGLMAIAFGLAKDGERLVRPTPPRSPAWMRPPARSASPENVHGGDPLLGDFLVVRFGRRAVTRFGGACSALGYLIAATGATLPVLLIGWSLVGLGIGMIAPQVYAVAGHTAGGRGLSVVVTFGYATFLIAPAIVGVVVQTIGIQRTMFLPAVLLSGLLLVARIMPGKEAPATELSEAH